jgi:predicted component of type VI protein secretion system
MSRHFVADAHRGDGKRFVVHADEKLTAFIELSRSNPLAGAKVTFGEVAGNPGYYGLQVFPSTTFPA